MALWRPFQEEAALELSRVPVITRAPPSPEYVPTHHGHNQHETRCPAPALPGHARPVLTENSLPHSSETMGSLEDDPEYQAYERDALAAMAARSGGALLGHNPRMRRVVQPSNEVSAAGESYRRQRERNNSAAKLSRDRRKLREMRLSLQVSFLKRRLATLRARLAAGECGHCRRIYQ